MESVLERKFERVFDQLVTGQYTNPFQYNGNIRRIVDKQGNKIKVISPTKTYKDCRSTGFYMNLPCEIITTESTITNAHHEHLSNIRNKWSMIPNILYVSNEIIIAAIPYNIKKIPNMEWVSASKTRNYLLDDPLIDYLRYKNINPIVNNPTSVTGRRKRGYSETFNEQLMNNGNNFEISVIDHIKTVVDPKDYIMIGESYEASNITKYLFTMKAINDGIGVIYQPVLWNQSNKTFGCADIIIKSSVAKELFTDYTSSYHNDVYEVYDIKGSTVTMLTGTNNLNNDKTAKTYKSQLWIYTQALNKMTNMNVKTAYILGKKYKKTRLDSEGNTFSKAMTNPFNELACVDFSREKANIKTFKKAISWVKEVKKNNKLCHDPPNDIRLYPNMKNHDSEYHDIKKDLAHRNKEITLLYNVGVNHRNNALSHDISMVNDPKLTTDILGLRPSLTTDLINNIISVNSQECVENILYNDMSNCGNWNTAKVRCYLDIEAINTSIYDVAHNRPNYIFMIGIGIVINDVWQFKVFTTDNLLQESEEKILTEFNTFMNKIANKHKKVKHIPIFHWSNYEKTYLEPLLMLDDKFRFHDVCAWVKDNGICVKGAYDFKLKNYTKALNKSGMINIDWPDGISDGINAMNTAYNYYTHDVGDREVITDVEKYNEIDCKSMFEIHQLCKTIV